MNIRKLLPPPHKNRTILKTILFSFVFLISISTNCSAATDRTKIESGNLYDEVVSFCPDVVLYSTADNILHVDLSNMEMANGEDSFALLYIKIAARILSCSNFSQTYTGAVFGYWKDDTLSALTITDFKDVGDFHSSLTVRSPLKYFSSSMQQYYDDIFGHYDLEYFLKILSMAISKSKGAPAEDMEVRNCNKFWLFSSFFTDIISFQIENNKMSVTINANGETLYNAGEYFYREYLRAAENFANIYNYSDGLLDFISYDITCIDPQTGETLLTSSTYLEDLKLRHNFSSNNSDFFSGLQNASSDSKSSNPLATASVAESNVMSGDKSKILGKRAYISISKAEMKNITQEQYSEFVSSRVSDSGYNWFSILFEDGTGITFAGCYTPLADYGKMDDEGCISELIGHIELIDGVYTYKKID